MARISIELNRILNHEQNIRNNVAYGLLTVCYTNFVCVFHIRSLDVETLRKPISNLVHNRFEKTNDGKWTISKGMN